MTRAITRSRVPLLLFVGGLVISGFTMLRGVEAFDEGLTLQAARRVADGQLPYSDFLWAYGPAHPYLLAGLFKAFGTSLLWWRIIRVIVDAGVALLVFVLVRERAPTKVAVIAWLVAACAMAQPTGPSPFAPALLCTLGALWFAARADRRRDWIVAGALCAFTAAWRLDFGVYALIACTAAAAVRAVTPEARSDRPVERVHGPVRAVATVDISFAVLTGLVYLPFAIADGPADLSRDLVGRSLREGHYWHLPFPIDYDGPLRASSFLHDFKDVIAFYVPLMLVIGLATSITVIAYRRLQRDPFFVGLAVLGCTFLVYLLSRTDEFHSTPLIVVLACLLPALTLQLPHRAAWVPALVLLGLLAYGGSNRLSALFEAPDLRPIHVAVADGVKAPPAEARAIERMVAAVQRRVPPKDPIYTVTRRSDLVRVNDPLIYFLTERKNPTDQDFGLQTKDPAQRAIVAALERSRPKVIVRWLDPISVVREPNDRGKPTNVRVLDDWLAQHYRPAERYGDYQLLVPNG